MFGFVVFLLIVLAQIVTISERKEQRATLKFLSKSGFSPIECWRQLKNVWADKTLGKTQIWVWHKQFLNGQAETSDKKRPGQPRTKTTADNIQKVSELLQAKGKLSLRAICQRTGLKMGVVVQIVKKELKMKRRAPKFMPTELTDKQKETRKEVCDANIEKLCDSPDPEQFLHSIISGDETWINTCEQESKQQSSVWLPPKSPRPKKALRIPGNKKTMLTLFCDAKGMILIDWLQPKETIDSKRYVQTLSKLKEALCQKRPQLWKERSFMVHHDNASPHTSFHMTKYINKWKLNLLDHPPNSLDLAPCDFGFFPKLKSELRGCRFNTVKDLQKEVCRILFSWEPRVFNDIFHDLVCRWQKCSAAEGSYFEGDNVQIDPLFVLENAQSDDESNSD